MADAFDFEIEQDSASDTSIQKMVAMANEVIATEKLVEELEENLSSVKKQLNKLKTVDLPDAMAECGMSEFKTEDGYRISIEDFVSGSLPKDDEKRKDAISWLETNGAESLIKTELTMQFEKSEHNMALSLAAELSEKGYTVNSKMGIHPQTLIAHIKERLKSGKEVPLELLGLYAGRVAKIKAKK